MRARRVRISCEFDLASAPSSEARISPHLDAIAECDRSVGRVARGLPRVVDFATPAVRCQRVPNDGACLAVNADRKSTRLNSSHLGISYAVFCLKKKKT